jgi:hypothetical protein
VYRAVTKNRKIMNCALQIVRGQGKMLSGGLLAALRNITINSVEGEGVFPGVNQGALSYLA